MSFKQQVEVIQFGDISEAVNDGNEQAIRELVTNVTSLAKTYAPVKTGQLRGSIMGRVADRDIDHEEGARISERPKEGEGYVGTAVLHGIYQEFGTRRNLAANPFLRPAIAVEANGAKAKNAVKKFQEENAKRNAKGPKKKRVYK